MTSQFLSATFLLKVILSTRLCHFSSYTHLQRHFLTPKPRLVSTYALKQDCPSFSDALSLLRTRANSMITARDRDPTFMDSKVVERIIGPHRQRGGANFHCGTARRAVGWV